MQRLHRTPTEARGGAEVEPKAERDCGDVEKRDGGADRGVARASLRAGGGPEGAPVSGLSLEGEALGASRPTRVLPGQQ